MISIEIVIAIITYIKHGSYRTALYHASVHAEFAVVTAVILCSADDAASEAAACHVAVFHQNVLNGGGALGMSNHCSHMPVPLDSSIFHDEVFHRGVTGAAEETVVMAI